MEKIRFFLLLFFLFSCTFAFGQSENFYFSAGVGYTFNYGKRAIDGTVTRMINTPDGIQQMDLTTKKNTLWVNFLNSVKECL